jgi:hypothetical protein
LLALQGNGTISLREQVQLFRKTKARIVRAGVPGLDDLLARSLFVVSSGGNDFGAFDDCAIAASYNCGKPMSHAPAFIAALVADYVEYITVRANRVSF